MKRFWNRRQSAVIVALLLIAAFLAVSPIAGSRLRGSSAEPQICPNLSVAEIPLAQKLWRAYESEGNGLLDEAETGYEPVLKAQCAAMRQSAVAGLTRLRRARQTGGFFFGGILTLAAASARLRSTVLIVAAVLLLAALFQVLFSRRGARLMQFSIYGCGDEFPADAFRDALLNCSNLIKRVYGSDYARHRGIQLFFDDLKGEVIADANPLERALAEARDIDAKLAVGLVLGQLLRYWRELPERPRLLVSGSVTVLPGSAKAHVVIRDVISHAETHVDASTEDAGALPMYSFVVSRLLQMQPATTPSGWKRDQGRRQIASELETLAMIVACKIRWRESQAVSAGQRPRRWETICLTAAAAKELV
jgi:hypothetical protein